MQVVKITKLNMQEGIRLIKQNAEELTESFSEEDYQESLAIVATEVKIKGTEEVEDVLVFGKLKDIKENVTSEKANFTVKSYFTYSELYNTKSVANMTNIFYKEVQER